MTTLSSQLAVEAATFQIELPHTEEPYRRRNWGNALHSLCSYQGKLKPSLAHFLVDRFVPSGGSVLDPLGGVGTVALEAALQGKHAVSNDLSLLASTVARAKLDPPQLDAAMAAVDRLRSEIETVTLDPIDIEAASFGLNAAVSDYYHPSTLEQILKARKLFATQATWESDMAFVWASLLHVLHGNRPYALSRRSHPITPFKPTGPTSPKDLCTSVASKIQRSLKDGTGPKFRPAESVHGDFRSLAAQPTFDAIITSPPFLGMRFDRPNWLRLWFCGWTAETFGKSASTGFLERQQVSDRSCYREFFDVCYHRLEPNGVLILHVGSGSKGDLADDLTQLSREWFHLEAHVVEDSSRLERHGIQDKRLTTTHSLLFLTRA